MLPLLQTALLALIPALILLFHWSRRHIYKHTKNIPSIQPNLPVIGNALQFKGDARHRMNVIMGMFDQVPEIAVWWFGPIKVYILVQKPEYLKVLFNHPSAINKDPFVYDTVKIGLRDGLVTEKEETWRKHRRIIAPAFNDLNVNRFCKLLSEHAKTLNDKFETYENQEFDFERLCVNASMDSFFESLLQAKPNAVVEDSEFPHVLCDVTDYALEKVTTLYTHIDVIYKFTELRKKIERHIEVIEKVVDDVMDRKLKEYNKSKELKQVSVTDLLIHGYLNNKLTKDEVYDQIQTLIFAGTDTTGLAMCFSLALLSMNPEIQDRVYEEINEVLDPNEDDVELNKINQLTYLECVIKESLRLIPVVPFAGRFTKEEVKLSDTVTIPKGVSTLTNILALHRSEHYWPNALKFDPDRFLPENVRQRHPYCFIPFLAGPRNCIGMKFSMLALKIKMALVLRKFRFYSDYKTVLDIPLRINILTHASIKLNVKCERRNK